MILIEGRQLEVSRGLFPDFWTGATHKTLWKTHTSRNIMIVMERVELARKITALRPRLEAEGVKHVALFGSRARGTNRPDSDIDILVEVAENSKFSVLNLIGVEHLVGDATGLAASAVMRRSLTPAMREEVSRDAVEIF
jgi:uncharacterized protein